MWRGWGAAAHEESYLSQASVSPLQSHSLPISVAATSLMCPPLYFKLALTDDFLCSVKPSTFMKLLSCWNVEFGVTYICTLGTQSLKLGSSFLFPLR